MPNLVDFALHIDKNLVLLIDKFGSLTYIIIFLVVFAETGLVVIPFLPGDSLLFALGALSAKGLLNLGLCYGILLVAAVAGDTTNYWIGHFLEREIFETDSKLFRRFFKKAYLERTERFYEKYGGRAVVLGRFVPIVRTFVPFVAGIGQMSYPRFLLFSIFGTTIWVSLFLFAGFFFGNLPAIKDNFSLTILAIIFISLVPGLIEFVRHKLSKKR